MSNYLNIDIKDTIAIGDNYNDLAMIKAAGLVCLSKVPMIISKRYLNIFVKKIILKVVLKKL